MEKGLKLIVLLSFKTVLQPCELAFAGGSQQLEQFQAFSCKVTHCMKMPKNLISFQKLLSLWLTLLKYTF